MIRVALVAIVALGCGGGSPGKLANQRRDPSTFVTEHQAMLVKTEAGLVRIMLDGSGRQQVVSGRYGLEAASQDGRVLVLEDSDTNLYIYDGQQPRQVHELDRRAGATDVTQDGSRVAVTRHADFSKPQSTWSTTEDDAVYLIDPHTLAVEIVPKTRDELVTQLWWEADRKGLTLLMDNFDTVRLDLATRERENLAARPERDWHRLGSDRCARTGEVLAVRGWKGDQGIDIAGRRLVIVEGRSRGFHDYIGTITSAVFTPSCRYVVFEFGRSVWVADVASGTIGELIQGGDPLLLVD